LRAPTRCLVIAAGIVLVATVGGPAEVEGQDRSPATTVAKEWLEVIRGGDETLGRAFIEARFAPALRDHVPMEEHVRLAASYRRTLHGLEEGGVLELGNTEARLLLAGGDRVLELRVRVEADSPHRITDISVGPAGPGVGAELTARTLEELWTELEGLAEADEFSGVVLLATAGEVVARHAFGPADRGDGRPVRPETRFDLGSIYKLFTSTAVLRLIQDGRLGLGDAVGKHVEGLDAAIAERVTVQHLLRHRSGLGDYLTDPSFEADPKRFRRPADYLALTRGQALAFEPGTRTRYSNMGFVLLGAIIEAVTGGDYHDVVDMLVFRPAGMTTAGPTGGPDAARRYHHMPDGWMPVDAYYPQIASPAGGGFAAAADLHRFADALVGLRLLDLEHTSLLLRHFQAPAPSDPAALPAEFAVGGGADGVAAAFMVRPAERTTVVVLANVDSFPVEDLARRVLELAPR
jgi:CubicO group peptidase (beta-lactamase class C family)